MPKGLKQKLKTHGGMARGAAQCRVSQDSCMSTALNQWIVTEMRWNKHAISHALHSATKPHQWETPERNKLLSWPTSADTCTHVLLLLYIRPALLLLNVKINVALSENASRTRYTIKIKLKLRKWVLEKKRTMHVISITAGL